MLSNILNEFHSSCCNSHFYTDHICYYLNLVYIISFIHIVLTHDQPSMINIVQSINNVTQF